MGSLAPEERPVMGALANDVRNRIEEMLGKRWSKLKLWSWKKLQDEDLDITLLKT